MKTLRTLTLIALSLTLLSCEKEELEPQKPWWETQAESGCNCGTVHGEPATQWETWAGQTTQVTTILVINDCTGNHQRFEIQNGKFPERPTSTSYHGRAWCHNSSLFEW